jgi:membrane protein DedA with SNARE-associated domain
MSLGKFCFYTAFGAGIWVTVLAFIGYFVGHNREKIMAVSREWSIYVIVGCALLVTVYIILHKRKQDAPLQ